MLRLIKAILVLLLMLGSSASALGFSLIGQLATWHVQRLGHAPGFIGGPVNINEEHRWNTPTIYWGVAPEFLTYFGSRGEEEMEKAVKVITDLPNMSTLNVDDYSLNVIRSNLRALRLNLLDLKSVALNLMLEEMGLGDPTLYVFTLRNRWIDAVPTTNYHVIKRNFDPITRQVSSHINGELWTFSGIADGANESITITQPVDPLSRNFPVSSLGTVFPGNYIVGLTRDDVGALKHIYSRNNHNVENAITNSFALGFGVIPGVGGSSPWAHPVFTNIFTNIVTDPNAPPAAIVNTNFINTAIRPGIDKLDLVRVDFDTLIGAFIQLNVTYTDTLIFNGQTTSQTLGRPLNVPDLLFQAADLNLGPTDPDYPIAARTVSYQSNAALNGNVGVGGAETGVIGPGIINPVIITFNSVGHVFTAGPWPNFLSEGTAFPGFIWGSYDGSTNAPVVYPDGTLLDDIENRISGGF